MTLLTTFSAVLVPKSSNKERWPITVTSSQNCNDWSHLCVLMEALLHGHTRDPHFRRSSQRRRTVSEYQWSCININDKELRFYKVFHTTESNKKI